MRLRDGTPSRPRGKLIHSQSLLKGRAASLRVFFVRELIFLVKCAIYAGFVVLLYLEKPDEYIPGTVFSQCIQLCRGPMPLKTQLTSHPQLDCSGWHVPFNGPVDPNFQVSSRPGKSGDNFCGGF